MRPDPDPDIPVGTASFSKAIPGCPATLSQKLHRFSQSQKCEKAAGFQRLFIIAAVENCVVSQPFGAWPGITVESIAGSTRTAVTIIAETWAIEAARAESLAFEAAALIARTWPVVTPALPATEA